MKKHKIYKIQNKVNNKIYVGYTKNTLQGRWNEHKRVAFRKGNNKFYNAMKFYGVSNFEIELIDSFDNKERALEMEKFYIKKYNTIDEGYNTHFGGNGGSVGNKKGNVLTEEHKRNISLNHHDVSGKNNPFYGKKHTEETRKKIGKRKYPTGKDHMWYKNPSSGAFKSGKDNPNSIQVIIDGVEYESITDAVNKLKISRRQVKKKMTITKEK